MPPHPVRLPRPAVRLALTLLLAAAPALADGEYLVQDLGTQRLMPPSEIERAEVHAVLDGVAYFYKDDGRHGYELWRSDGTVDGTYLLRDICPGVCGADAPSQHWLAATGSSVFFSADDAVHGSELWLTDGTVEGTRMVADVLPGPLGSNPMELTAGAGQVYFLASNRWPDRRIWVSDGTAAGTTPLFEANDDPLGPGLISTLTWANGLLYAKGGQLGPLWRSDGTVGGTFQVHPQASLPDSWHYHQAYQVLPDGALVFQGCDEPYGQQNCEPWRTDGTVAGTWQLADIVLGPESSNATGFVRVGAEVWFGAWATGTSGQLRLYRTDGTVSGTSQVPLPTGLEPRVRNTVPAAALASGLVFVGCDAEAGCEPWFTDGTDCVRLADIVPGPDSSLDWYLPVDRPRLTSVGSTVLFLATTQSGAVELWRTDGTVAGTTSVSDLDAPPDGTMFGGFYSAVFPPIVANGRWILPIFRGDRGTELWRSDGTASGTLRLATMADEASGYLAPIDSFHSPLRLACMAPLNDGVVTKVANVQAPVDSWLVFTDGEPGGAVVLHPLDQEYYGREAECAAIGDEVVVSGISALQWQLLRTQGTVETTEPLPGVGGYPMSVPAFEPTRTAAVDADRLAIVTDEVGLALIPAAGSPESILTFPAALQWGELVSAGERLFLADSYGRLEITDGSEAPTLLLEAPSAPEPWHELTDAVAVGEQLFFVLTTPEEGAELWRSDGTVEGTGPVRSLQDGPAGGFDERPIWWMMSRPWRPRIAALDDERIVFQASDGVSGFELWTSDGTEAGTVLVADLVPGPGGSWPRHLTSLGDGTVLFAAEHPVYGYELFRTDGTAAGTALVADLVPGIDSSVPDELTVVDGIVYFSAWTSEHGREAWRTDGTAVGTWRLTDVAPGPLSSSPANFVRSGGRLFFSASDHVHGFELWAMPEDGSGSLFLDGFESGDTSRWSDQLP